MHAKGVSRQLYSSGYTMSDPVTFTMSLLEFQGVPKMSVEHADPNADLANDRILKHIKDDWNVIQRFSLLGLVGGLVTLILLCLALSKARAPDFSLPIGCTVFFWALASFVVGALFGFLFGIPHLLEKSIQPDAGQPKSGSMIDDQAPAYKWLVSTHLDDVSEWFTKIIVGVSLVELGKIQELLQRLAFSIAPKQEAFTISVLVYFSTVGFLSGYLNTRMFIQHAFRLAHLDALRERKVRESAAHG